MDSLSKLQERYEGRGQEIALLKQERDALNAAATASERKREASAAEVAYLKDSHSKVATDLNNTRMQLLGSSLPGVAELERALAEIRRLQGEIQGYEKKISSVSTELDFFRTQYQNVSSVAGESAEELRTLQSEVELLRTKASDNMLELHKLNHKTENDALAAHISRLQATLAHCEEQLRKKEEEIKQFQRGRGMGTRGSSVLPGGSPRASGSRGASPVGGETMLRMGSTKSLGSGLRFGARLGTGRGEEEV